MTTTPAPVGEFSPVEKVHQYAESARARLAELLTPAPCGHQECTDSDAASHALLVVSAETFCGDMETMEVPPEVAARVLAALDIRFIWSAATLNSDVKIPAEELHQFLATLAATLLDRVSTPEPAGAE